MGWVDPEYIPVLQQDHRYARLLNLTKRLLEERVPACGNCTGGTITMRDPDGNETTVQCDACSGKPARAAPWPTTKTTGRPVDGSVTKRQHR